MSVPPRYDVLFWVANLLDTSGAAAPAAADELGAQVLFIGSISPMGLVQIQAGKVRP